MHPHDLQTEAAYRRERLLSSARKRRSRSPAAAGRLAPRAPRFVVSRRRRVAGRTLLGAAAVAALLVADGTLSVVLVVAYVLLGGHQAWRRAKAPRAVSGRAADGQRSRAEPAKQQTSPPCDLGTASHATPERLVCCR